jgi:hypothetical protein
MMRFLRFVFPFLFVRNWHDGRYEVSRTRLILTLFAVGTVVFFIFAVTLLQWPVTYIKTV